MIVKTLGDPCAMKNTPEFKKLDKELTEYITDKTIERALMLKAPWGSGKTTAIKYWLEQRTSEHRIVRWTRGKLKPVVHISVYGIKSQDELNERIFLEFINKSPWGTSLKVFRTIGQKIAEATGGSIKFSNSSLWRIVRKKPIAIILDDLERASAPIEVLFGGINDFIENYGVKVLLICDHDELLRKDTQNTMEKIVHNTITFPIDTAAIIKNVVTDAMRHVEEPYRANQEINDAISHSGTKNIRTALKAIDTHRRLSLAIAKNPPDLLSNFANLSYATVALTIDYHEKKITVDDLKDMGRETIFDRQKTALAEKMIRFKNFRVTSPKHTPLTESLAHMIIIDNCQNEEVLTNEIKDSSLYKKGTLSEWEYIYHRTSTDRTIVEAAIIEQQRKIEKMEYKDTGIVLHVFANKLKLSYSEIITDTPDEIELEAKEYINNLSQIEDVHFHLNVEGMPPRKINNEHYKSKGYPSQEEDKAYKKFNSISEHLITVFEDRRIRKFEEEYIRIFSNIKNNYQECRNAIMSRYPNRYEEEFLHKLDVSNIAEQICGLPNSQKHDFMLSIGSRLYSSERNRSNEENWRKALGVEVIARANKMHPIDKEAAVDAASAFLLKENSEEG